MMIYAQMKPLNDLYDWGMSAEIVSKTIPLVELDPYFDNDVLIIYIVNMGLLNHYTKIALSSMFKWSNCW